MVCASCFSARLGLDFGFDFGLDFSCDFGCDFALRSGRRWRIAVFSDLGFRIVAMC